MKPIVLSLRIPGNGSPASKFADLTHDWLDEFVDDYEQRTGEVDEGGNGVLFACDVLVNLHGADASWERFDVRAFEAYIREQVPGFVIVLPTMLADLAAFTSYLAARGRLAFERHVETMERLVAIMADAEVARRAAERGDRPTDDDVMPPPNRAERRAAARYARRRR
jgi:hypothetical protein